MADSVKVIRSSANKSVKVVRVTVGLTAADVSAQVNLQVPAAVAAQFAGTAATRAKLSFDTAANWAAANPVLALDERAFATDSGLEKVGDGATAWADLPAVGSAIYVAFVKASGDTTGATDAAAIQAKLDAANTAGGGIVLLGAGVFWQNARLVIHANTALVGMGVGVTILKVANDANVQQINNGNTTTGDINITLDRFTVDGNKVNQSGDKGKGGVHLVGCNNLNIGDLEVANCDGFGFYHEGISGQPRIQVEQYGNVYCHDNARYGFRNSLRSRKCHYGRLVCTGNGEMGAFIDSSECSGNILADSNGWDGVWIHNVYGYNGPDIVASRNGASGILVTGLCDSDGGRWVAWNNGKTGIVASYHTADSALPEPVPLPTATADVYFSGDNTLSYGATKRARVDITAGFNATTAIEGETVVAAYALYVEDGVDADLRVKLLGAGTTAATRLPAGMSIDGGTRVCALSADQTVNNATTAVVATGMSAAVDADATYLVEVAVSYSAATAADLKVNFNAPAGLTGHAIYQGLNIDAASAAGSYTAGAGAVGSAWAFGGAGVGTVVGATIKAKVTTTTAGTLAFKFAQNVADASNATLYALGSYMKVTRIG